MTLDMLEEINMTVSIPFKREGLSERRYYRHDKAIKEKFQFPSNGKVFLNEAHSD